MNGAPSEPPPSDAAPVEKVTTHMSNEGLQVCDCHNMQWDECPDWKHHHVGEPPNMPPSRDAHPEDAPRCAECDGELPKHPVAFCETCAPVPIPEDFNEYVPLCRAGKDGDCTWEHCPQNRDGESERSGRHCPIDLRCDRCEESPWKCRCPKLDAHPEDAPGGPTGCFRDHTVKDQRGYCWFVRFPGEYRQGPYLEETARLIYKHENERRDLLNRLKGETDG